MPYAGRSFIFMRHGETDYNRRQLRCGGDVDIPLTDRGEEQAREAGAALAQSHPQIDVVIASPLLRTRRTAELAAAGLGGRPIVIHPGLLERRLGAWNGLPIADTQAALTAGETPPGGESEAVFQARIIDALIDILGRGDHLPLLVASKGVARIIGGCLEGTAGQPAANAAPRSFTVPPQGLRV